MILSVLSSILELNHNSLMILALIYVVILSYLLYKWNPLNFSTYEFSLAIGLILLDLAYTAYRTYQTYQTVNHEEMRPFEHNNANISHIKSTIKQNNVISNMEASKMDKLSTYSNAKKDGNFRERQEIQEIQEKQEKQEIQERQERQNDPEKQERQKRQNDPEKPEEIICDNDYCYRRAIDIKNVAHNTPIVEVCDIMSENETELHHIQTHEGINVMNEESEDRFLLCSGDDKITSPSGKTIRSNPFSGEEIRPGMGIKILDEGEEGPEGSNGPDDGYCRPNSLRIQVRDI